MSACSMITTALAPMRLGLRERGVEPAQVGGGALRDLLDLRAPSVDGAEGAVFQRSSSLFEPPGMLTVTNSTPRLLPHHVLDVLGVRGWAGS